MAGTTKRANGTKKKKSNKNLVNKKSTVKGTKPIVLNHQRINDKVISTDKLSKNNKTTVKKKMGTTKAKQKALVNSRKANVKEVSSKKKKREATRIIPVDKILEAQRQAELAAKVNKKDKFIDIDSKVKKGEKSNTNQRIKSKKTLINREKQKNKKTKKEKKKIFDLVKKNKNSIKKINGVGKTKSKIVLPKTKKIYLAIVVLCVLILLIEGVYFLIVRNNREQQTTYYDSLNSLTLDGTDIVAVGSSNFKKSKYNSYTKGLEKAKLVKYDKNGTIIFEKMYDNGINSTFNAVISVSDGYVAVGSYEKNKEQAVDDLRDALIVKYDKDGKILWEKSFTSLSNSQFNKVVVVNDGYVVIGQSIYATMEMGNSEDGGGVIIKYSLDGEVVWTRFHGGTKSGSFNGITVVDGNFYVVGRDGTDFGNLIKYSSDGTYEWHHNYRYTDTLGLSDIVYANGKLYAVGSKEIFETEVTDDDERNTTNTDALLICFTLDGEIEFERTFGGSNQERYNAIMSYGNNLFAIGSSNSEDSGLKIFTDGEKTTGILVKYDLSGNIERKNIFGGSNQDNLTDIVTDNSNLYITAYTSSKDGNIIISGDNGKDYHGRLIKVDSRLRVLYLI